MQFKFKQTEVKISFSFFAVLLISIVSGTSGVYLCSLGASLIHELVHIIFILLFRARIISFSLTLFGGKIIREATHILSNTKESIISLSAPSLNILIGAVSMIINNKSMWGVINLFIGVLNILPFFTFDGGRGLFYLITIKLTERTANYILDITSVIITVIFSFFSVFIFLKYNNNLLLLCVCVYMILSLIIKKQNINTNCNIY